MITKRAVDTDASMRQGTVDIVNLLLWKVKDPSKSQRELARGVWINTKRAADKDASMRLGVADTNNPLLRNNANDCDIITATQIRARELQRVGRMKLSS